MKKSLEDIRLAVRGADKSAGERMGPHIEKDSVDSTISDVYRDDLNLAPESMPDHMHEKPKERPPNIIILKNVAVVVGLHLGASYGIYLLPQAKILTMLWTILLVYFGGIGITVGAHRLWSHRSFKAKLPLRIFLAAVHSLAFQNDIIHWVRDHRTHHKYSETDAGPHNAERGFFFAHVGWLMVKKHPDVKNKGKLLDISDLYADPVCRMQRKFYKSSVVFMSFLLPMIVPVYFWRESWTNAYFIPAILRFVFTLNVTWLVNSAAHMWGARPYDETISPTDNKLLSVITAGEGFHNFHHTFPQDYSTSELGRLFNLSTAFIDFFERLGQVYDKKKVPQHIIDQRRKRTGDKSTKSG